MFLLICFVAVFIFLCFSDCIVCLFGLLVVAKFAGLWVLALICACVLAGLRHFLIFWNLVLRIDDYDARL